MHSCQPPANHRRRVLQRATSDSNIRAPRVARGTMAAGRRDKRVRHDDGVLPTASMYQLSRPASVESLSQAALRLLDRNRQRGVDRGSGLRYDYSCPSRRIYPYQWLWDSCFHAIVLARLAPSLAAAELATLLSMVQPNGFLPHVVFWGGPRRHHAWPLLLGLPGFRARFSAQTQPPMVAIAVERYLDATNDFPFLNTWLPSIVRYYDWLSRRDWDRDGLLTIVQPFESGLDASPQYDRSLGLDRFSPASHLVRSFYSTARYSALAWEAPRIERSTGFSVEDLLFNSVYAYNLRALQRLCVTARQDGSRFARRAAATERSLISKCFDADNGYFVSLFGGNEERARVLTVASLMPLLARDLPEGMAASIAALIEAPKHFNRRYPLPSVAASESTYAPGASIFLWRGPTWLSTNWLVYQGLRQHGYVELASHVADRTAALVLKSGFREYYNPETGEGYGADQFGWSTLAIDMLRSEQGMP